MRWIGARVVCVAVGVLAGCSDTALVEPGCIEGQVVACTCDDVKQGVSTCAPDGTLGDCDCGGQGAAQSGVGASGEDTSGQAEGSGDGNGSGTPNDSAAGMGGDTGDTSDMSQGGNGSEPDNDTGAAGGTDMGGTDTDPAPPPGTLARCATSADCMGDLECASAGFRPGVGYCSARCQSTQDCPAPTTGTVAAECDALTGLCRLGSCANAACPDGMTCQPVWGGFAGMICQF